jgi:hypothetical protein
MKALADRGQYPPNDFLAYKAHLFKCSRPRPTYGGTGAASGHSWMHYIAPWTSGATNSLHTKLKKKKIRLGNNFCKSTDIRTLNII